MDSRIIFEKDKFLINKIKWIKDNTVLNKKTDIFYAHIDRL